MANVEVSYLGLKLKNPLIISSSGLTNSLKNIQKLENGNAGAIVLKSLFEEQIKIQSDNFAFSSVSEHAESAIYLREYTKSNLISDYLSLVRDAKIHISIPVIASINCYSAGNWIDFARKIEDAGADAIELNVFVLPLDGKHDSAYYENIYFEILKKIKKSISIPVSLKISSSFTNLLYFVEKLSSYGAGSVILFNRYYQPDINTDDLTFGSAEIFSDYKDYYQSLRWVGIISGKTENIELVPSTGVHSGETVIKFLLAGARAVQICSTIYRNGYLQINKIIDELGKWMDEKKFECIGDFRGKMNYRNIPDPFEYERSQFIRYFSLKKE